MCEARAKYGEALNQLNLALRDPVAVKQDDTLMTVLLLGMVEVSSLAFWRWKVG